MFNDSDLQMAGYAAALKVLTGYTHIGGEDVTAFAMRPRVKGEVTVAGERLPSIVVLGDVEIADPWSRWGGLPPERLGQRLAGVARAHA